MAASAAIAVKKHLCTGYHPEWDDVDGKVRARHGAADDRSALPIALTAQWSRCRGQLPLGPLTGMRVRVGLRSYRVPAMFLVRTDQPLEPVLTTPPWACFEATPATLRRVTGRVLRGSNPELTISLDELFSALN